MRPAPDIITFQEVYRSAIPPVQSILGDSVLELTEHFKEYNAVFGHSGGIGHLGFELGKLTFSKYPIMDAAKLQLNGSRLRSILRTKIDTPDVPTHVYNVHTTGVQSQLREIIAYIGSTAKEHERVIIAGDLNMDISRGAAGRTLLEQEGFVVSDVGPTALVGISLERARYWRSIDCIAVRDENPALVSSFERVLDTYSADAKVWPSDHAGIRAELIHKP
jgi:endonuclease/exonuclease/phosphatase family metal-dependent hydrolase